MQKILIIVFLTLFLAPLVYSQEIGDNNIGSFKLNTCAELKQICANCTYVNITSINNRNNTVLGNHVVMQKIGTEYNYTFCNNSILGDYHVSGIGNPDGEFITWDYFYTVTPLGNVQTTSQGIGGLGTIAIFISLTFMFAFLTFAFTQSENYKPLSLLFFGLMAIFILVSLHLCYVYARDVAVMEATSETIRTVYFVTMWIFVGVILVGSIFLLKYVLDYWNVEKQHKNSDDGWDGGLVR